MSNFLKTELKLKEGESYAKAPNSPIIGITGTGRSTYLWIGNDSENDKFCFATVSGAKRLEKFAREILKSINAKQYNK